mmetsp:Transcript_15725/g.15087  ORF Transcript_15725/g.15087 Transcript_15725/m.15087 type:complete len:132 (+) Transcript_15725:173-568(+)
MSLPYHRGHLNAGSEMNQRSNNGSNFGSRDQRVEEANRTIMEQENDRKWEELGEQVSMLKGLTVDINQEVKGQNKMLDGMGTTFGTAGDLFNNTIGKLGTMMTTSSSYHMYYLMMFVVFIFLVLYFLMGKK